MQTRRMQTSEPLIIKAQGSFFVGGEDKRITVPGDGHIPAESGDITVNQMYVQYQIPMKGDRHTPVVMVHGCCLSSKVWETTPDGRMGWSEYFIRNHRPVYLAEQVSRARSGFEPSAFNDVRSGGKPTGQLPRIMSVTHESAWIAFRVGPKLGQAFPDEQFPTEAIDEFYKQLIPDLNATLSQNPNPTWLRLAALGARLRGAVLVGHSQSGFFPQQAALIDPPVIKGIVSIEPECATDFTPAQIAALSRVPTLIMFGDHLADASARYDDWMSMFASCNALIERLKSLGGDARMMYLPGLGIKGNSHMLMQDRNNRQLADLVLAWIDRHVERAEKARPRRHSP